MPLDEALFRVCRLLRGEPSLPGSRQAGDQLTDFLGCETRDGVEIGDVLPEITQALHGMLPTFSPTDGLVHFSKPNSSTKILSVIDGPGVLASIAGTAKRL